MALIWEATREFGPVNARVLDWLLDVADGPCCWLRYDALVELTPYRSVRGNRRVQVSYTTPNGSHWLDYARGGVR